MGFDEILYRLPGLFSQPGRRVVSSYSYSCIVLENLHGDLHLQVCSEQRAAPQEQSDAPRTRAGVRDPRASVEHLSRDRVPPRGKRVVGPTAREQLVRQQRIEFDQLANCINYSVSFD